ncbi:MAG: manganese-dependent inorganic pyrophosphatase [Candidatus Nomurabacteria bacterium]|jgi:manganese-dependent inorganic pyrophosphatase|nr:manganese-dependent inorganic pyrophosphatase [Candidatus Nomurabacteria bacterium]
MATLVFGHTSPDTDTIVSAIALASFLDDAEACALGEPNKETAYVLEKFSLDTPRIIEKVAGQKVAIVDTTELSQLPSDIEQAEIERVVDHHRLGGLTTAAPVNVDVRPWGCTSTVVWSLFIDIFGRAVPKNIAGAMVCAILSDTVLFKSPTTTKYDRRAVEELASTAGIEDVEGLGMEMLKVKSSIADDSAADLVKRDYKDFDFNGKKVGIGQVELVELAMIDPKLDDLKAELQKLKTDGEYWGVIMLITDIMKEGSLVVAYTDDDAEVGRILGGELVNGQGWIDGIMSRKKQVAAPLAAEL